MPVIFTKSQLQVVSFYVNIKCYFSLNKFNFMLPVPKNSSCLNRRRSTTTTLNTLFSCKVVNGTKYYNKLGSVTTKNYYSTSSTRSIQPEFVTGVSDAESSFFITFIKSNKYSLGYTVQLSFQISLHKQDKALLELIKSYFGVGNILMKATRELAVYQVTSIKDLTAVINHFNKYSLITNKKADYELFQMAFNLINQKEHLKKVL